jgi:hypothetical protein
MVTVRIAYELSRSELAHAVARLLHTYNYDFPSNKSSAYDLVRKALQYWGNPIDPRNTDWALDEASAYEESYQRALPLFSEVD